MYCVCVFLNAGFRQREISSATAGSKAFCNLGPVSSRGMWFVCNMNICTYTCVWGGGRMCLKQYGFDVETVTCNKVDNTLADLKLGF